MNKNYTTMINNVSDEIQDTSTTFKAIIGEYLNSRYFQVLRAINWQNIRNDYTFDTVAGTQEYVLPDDFGKEIAVVDDTNEREIVKTDYQRLIMENPSTYRDNGSIAAYYRREDTVKAQPSAASAIAITSSSASDTTQTVLVRGIVSGVETSESVTVTGTSAASTTASFSRVKAISKSANTVGYITATSNSAAVTLAVLAPKVLESRYKLMGFFYVPSSVCTIRVPYIIKPLPLIEDYDYPVLDIADILEIGAKADAWRFKRQFSKAGVFEALFTSQLSEYIWEKENDPNMIYQFKPAMYNKDNLY